MKNHDAQGNEDEVVKHIYARPYPRLQIEDTEGGRFVTPRPIWRPLNMPTVQYVPKEKRDSVRSLALLKTLATISRERRYSRSVKKTLLHLFMQGTTGLDRLIDAHNNRIRFSVWLTTYSVLIGSMLFLIYTDFKKFFEYPTASAIGLQEPETIVFPAVTICNLNYLNKSTFCEDMGVLEGPRNEICTNDQIDRPDVFSFVADGLQDSGKHKKIARRDILKVVSKHAMAWNTTLLRCHLNGRNCRSASFIKQKTTTNPEYGDCFTLFSESTRVRASGETRSFETIRNSEDHLDGLHLVLDARNIDYVPFLVEEGFVLMIHKSKDDADVSEQGIMIPTNRATYIGVEKELISLMEAPYDTNCHPSTSWPPDILGLSETLAEQVANKSYATTHCKYICRAFNLADICDCKVEGLSFDFALLCEEQHRRDPVSNLTCKEEFTTAPYATAQKQKKTMRCHCPNRCSEVRYFKKVSYAAFTESAGRIEGDKFRKQTVFHRRYAEVFVFFKTMRADTINITAGFTLIMMITEIGGFIGCFVGMAFMSIYEILENFLIALLYRLGRQSLGQSE